MAAMLERLEFRERASESVNLELPRMPRAMKPGEFLLGTILAVDVGFSQFPGMLPGIFFCGGAEYLRVFFVVVAWERGTAVSVADRPPAGTGLGHC